MARKDVSAVVSGAGFAASFWVAFDKAVRERGGTEEDIYRIGMPEGEALIGQFADLTVADGQKRKSVFRVSVNYDQPLADAIAAGRYDSVNSDIVSDHFPSSRTGTIEVEIHLIHFDKSMESAVVLREFYGMGLRAAEPSELLALGAAHPDLEREFPIIALGSVWQGRGGDRGVPFLGRDGSERVLGLAWVGGGWFGFCRFAAVRK